MNRARFTQLEEIYRAVLGQPLASRAQYIIDSCGDDDELRSEIELLLSYDELNSQFLDSSPEMLIAEAFGAEEEKADFVKREISHYRIERLIGEGGMGKVYLAEDVKLNRQVALKLLPDALIGDKDRLRRFEREARAASALNHPNILTVHEFGDDEGVHFIATEFVDGETLRDRIRDIDAQQALDIAIQIASALSAAHDAGITHRDIKPENIMIRSDGYIKVLDFGLAKVKETETTAGSEDQTKALLKTEPGSIMGTDAYMSPEQARGKKVDARSDIWSLGVVVYEMLAGTRPFTGESRADIIASVLKHEPRTISSFVRSLGPEADWVVAKALTKDVEARYQTAKELRADLAKIKDQVSIDAKAGHVTGRDEARIHSTLGNRIHSTLGVDQSTNAGQKRRTRLSSLWPTRDSGVVHPRLSPQLLYPVLGVFLLAAISVGAYFGFFYGGRSGRIDSIAVLPFENITGDANLKYVSDGMSNALIDRFAQLPQLKVISRNSSFKFRGSNIDVKDAASQLGARAIVTGSVQRSGDDIVVRVDVVDTSDDRQLSGAEYRRKASEFETLRNEIAKDTAEQLNIKLTDAQTKRLVQRSTENSEAYRYYLNGLVALDGTPEGHDRALPYFEKAIELDPEFALPHAEAAWVYYLKAISDDDPAEVMPKVKAAVEKALALDSELAKARVMRAVVYEYELNWSEAEREYLHAIELSPNLDFARNNYAWFLSVLDRQDEALAQFEEQRIRDPLSMRLLLLNKAWVLVQARRFDDALQTYREVEAVEPSSKIPDFALGYAYAGKGLNNEAISYYKRAIVDLGGEEKYSQPLVYLAVTYAKMPEKRAEARAILTRLENMNEYVSPALLAAIYAELGENDKAMELLEQAFIKRDLLLRFIKTAYEYDGLRADPRFTDLMRRMGLAQ
ncbi:MAG: protein kinase domain-containing protein [Pyrinomonadaceae bacterium]